jgi:carboxymethylenebutenolidase
MSVRSEWVDLTVDDGTAMRAWVARPEGVEPRRGLLVFQEAFGVNAHIREVTERFAADGFIAVSPELFHRTGPGFEGSYGDFAGVMPHFQAITEQGLDADVRTAYGWLERAGVGGNTAATGYCMGGRVAFIANSAVPLKAAVSYYGGGIPPLLSRVARLSGPMLFFWGGLDTHIPEEQQQTVITAVHKAQKVYVNTVFSNADHGFFCDARASYQPQAAAQAWSLTQTFFDTYCPR